MHWNGQRIISLLEVRRAQGFPDAEVLIGNGQQRMRIVGNAVDRHVALALGMSLRQAWLASGIAKRNVSSSAHGSFIALSNSIIPAVYYYCPLLGGCLLECLSQAS